MAGERRLYLAAAGGTRLHVSVERDGHDGKMYNPTPASQRRLEGIIKKIKCAPFVSLGNDRIGLIYDAPKRARRPVRRPVMLGIGIGGRA